MKAKSTTRSTELTFSTQTLVRNCLVAFLTISCSLALLDLWISAPGRTFDEGIQIIFNLTREDGLGNWYGSTLWFCIAVVLWACVLRLNAEKNKQTRIWFVAALLFSYAAIDDGSRIHEGFGGALQRHIAAVHTGGQSSFFDFFPTYHWHLLFAPIFGTMAALLVFIAFWHMKKGFARWTLLTGLCLLVIAVGFDSLEGLAKYRFVTFAEFVSEQQPYNRHLLKVIEETIETCGLGLILASFVSFAAHRFPQWKVQFKA